MDTSAQTKHTKVAPIYLMLFIVVVIWGTNVVMIKYLTNFFTPTALAALRISAATAILLPIALLRHGRLKLSRRDWLPIIGVAMFCIALHQLALSWGLFATSGTHAALILALNPLFTTMMAARFSREPISWYKAAGVILSLGGIMLIISQNVDSSSPTLYGDILIFIAMFLYVVGSLLIKTSTATVPPLVVTTYSHVIASLILIVVAAFTTSAWAKAPFLEIAPISIFFCSSWLATALGALWWITGIQRIGASTASLFVNICPVVGIFTSVLFLNEQLNWQHFASLLLVLSGVGLGTGLVSIDSFYRKRPCKK